jgi:hypothetical protein
MRQSDSQVDICREPTRGQVIVSLLRGPRKSPEHAFTQFVDMLAHGLLSHLWLVFSNCRHDPPMLVGAINDAGGGCLVVN